MHNENIDQSKYEKLFWSIAFPGFGQLLNGKWIKGILFIGLEVLINVQANLNEVIISSFHGDIHTSVQQADYLWLMFYPCIYFFAMWDAFRDAGGGREPYSFFPFVFAAYTMTVGLIYSSKWTVAGQLLGVVWLPLLSILPGLLIGYLLKIFLTHKLKK